MGMDMQLAREFGTAGVGSDEAEKTASAQLFVKLASQQGLDLSKFSDEQVAELYNGVMAKAAGEMPPQFQQNAGGGNGEKKDEEKKDEKKDDEKKDDDEEKEAAAREFARLQDFQKEAAHADQLGRRMAHALVNELQQIGDYSAKTAAAGAGAAPAAATAAARSEADGLKLASIDMQAIKHAVAMAKEAGFDAQEAQNRLAALVTLGQAPSFETSKVASASTLEMGIQVRALEYLEAAGYPVTWDGQQG